MKYLLLFGILISSIFLSAQVQEENRIFNTVLHGGEQLKFGDKSIRFKEVISDSRCPKDVTCIWAGEAKVLIEIFEKGKRINEKIVVINTSIINEIPLQFSAGGRIYCITAFRLFPYPSTASKKDTMHYTLEMQVSENL
jgi:hypothetical protein